MDNENQGFPESFGHWPSVDQQQQEPSIPKSEDEKKPFINKLNFSDSLLECTGYIHSINHHVNNDDKGMYFIRAGILQGSVRTQEGFDNVFESVDLIVGVTLKKWAERFLENPDALSKIMVKMQIKNLRAEAEMYKDKPQVKKRGVLETISIGHIDK